MSRLSFARRWRRLAASRTRPPLDDPDRALIGLCRDLAEAVSAQQLLLEGDGRDTDEIPGFDALADREAEVIRQVAALPAHTLPGVVAKAQGALLRPEVRGYAGALTLALSAAEDLVRLATGLERPPSADPSVPPGHARATLPSDPNKLKEQIMNNLFSAGRRASVRGRDVARGALVGLLGELGAWSVVGGIALLITRPDLPQPFPAALVLVGLGAIALALAWLYRLARP